MLRVYEKSDLATEILNKLKVKFKGVLPYSDRIIPTVKLINDNKSLGMCRKQTLGDYTLFNIYLNKKMLSATKQEIENTLLHELIHTIEGCFEHGYKFHKVAQFVNTKYGYNIQVKTKCRAFAEQINYKYEVVCTKCGSKHKYTRKTNVIKHPNLYHCTCGGGLEVRALDKEGKIKSVYDKGNLIG